MTKNVLIEISKIQSTADRRLDKLLLFKSHYFKRSRSLKLILPESVSNTQYFSNQYGASIRNQNERITDPIYALHYSGQFNFISINPENHYHGNRLLVNNDIEPSFESSKIEGIAIPCPLACKVYPWTIYSNFIYLLIKFLNDYGMDYSNKCLYILLPLDFPINILNLLQRLESRCIFVKIVSLSQFASFTEILIFDGYLEIIDRDTHLQAIKYFKDHHA